MMRDYILISEALGGGFQTIESIQDEGIRHQCCLAFNELADLQRGKPEMMGGAMMYNRGMHPNATGLYTYSTEHVGDLTHRMAADWATGDVGEGDFGFEFVLEKVERALRHYRHGYGFEREIREQAERNHALYVRDGKTSVAFNEWWLECEEAGIRYAKAHAALPVYNDAHWHARQAAIDLGNMDFTSYGRRLERLEAHLGTPDEWKAYASLVRIGSGGTPIQID